MRSKWIAVTIALALWAAPPSAPAAAAQLRVVATFSILGDLVRNVGGERLELHTLVGPDQDTHTFEPDPLDVAALARAAVVFENGLGFEVWLETLHRSSRSAARRVAVTDGLEPDSLYESRHGRREPNPHMWHDPARAAHMVRRVRDALAAADPPNAEFFNANTQRYIDELRALDAWIFEQVKAVPTPGRVLVTAHGSLEYFAARYGFRIPGSALDSLTTEASDPSAGGLAALVKEIRSAGVRAVFPESIHSRRLMERLAAEAGVRLGPALYTDSLGRPGTPGETYLKAMRYNVQAIVRALRP